MSEKERRVMGSLADICSAKRHVRFTRNSDRKSGYQSRVMSALPPKADMCGATRDVCFGHKRTFQRCRYSSFVDGFYQREFGLVQWARYAIAAIEPGLLPTINASSSFTRYRKGVSAVVSPDFFLPLMWPQMTSKG